MSKIILYIAKSLDGYIAKPNGDLEWLTSFPAPASGDYGYAALLDSIDTIIMGRKTYHELLGFGIEWPYSGFNTYIVTSNKALEIKSPDTFLITENIAERVAELTKKATKNIWLVGGGELVTAFLDHALIDTMIISIVPTILGEGIPLFAGKPTSSNWVLTNTEAFNTGLVNLTYQKNQQ